MEVIEVRKLVARILGLFTGVKLVAEYYVPELWYVPHYQDKDWQIIVDMSLLDEKGVVVVAEWGPEITNENVNCEQEVALLKFYDKKQKIYFWAWKSEIMYIIQGE